MTPNPINGRRKRPITRIIAISILAILTAAGIYLYNNFNNLLADALLRSFNSNIASDVYELKFEKLRVNLLEGSIRVFDVVVQPRAKPAKDYPYINSSLRLKADRLTLMKVEIQTLLRSSVLQLERISLTKPEIELVLSGKIPILLPFKDTAAVVPGAGASEKKAIEGFGLNTFRLIDASIHVTNLTKEREFRISDLDLSLDSLLINQQPGEDMIAFKHVELGVGEFKGRMQKGGLRNIQFKDFKLGVDSLKVQKTVDTVMFRFDDFGLAVNNLDLNTADSLFHFSLNAFNLSYKDKSITLDGLLYQPNISDAAIQNRYEFQHTQISATVGRVKVTGLQFDSLIYRKSLFIDNITIDHPDVAIFKDNTKPVNKARFPKYLGQQIGAVPLPLLIKQVDVTNVNLTNVERKRDSSYAKVIIGRGSVSVKNVTNRSVDQPLTISANAYINGKVNFDARLGFSYRDPQFTLDGKLARFDLPDLNPLIQAYTPAKINAGIADEISFTGMVKWTGSSGTMKFLYHDLDVDLDLKEQARWKSSVLAFAANSIVNASNPGSSTLPPRIVHLQATRDMNKGFVNIIIKSVLSGVKETMIMSKENRKTYKEAKNKAKKEKRDK